ncbi:MAG TPA: long-chain fatty acid--CoA ligase [Streptosporangiaceae bacterium]|nr:long-chain fatty acid--CoA ligase [Streptosporangiaceae bacterium]
MSPSRTAIIHNEVRYTYRDIFDRSSLLAGALRGLGIGFGDRVAYLGPNAPQLAETLFACGMLGAIFVPLNYRLAGPELTPILSDCEPRLLIRDPACPALFPGPAVTLDEYPALLGSAAALAADVPVSLDDVCMIQYTSGTSGRPKGVTLTHGNITWNCYNLLIDVDVTADEVSLVSSPMFHTAALNQLFLPTFLKGGTSVLMPAFTPDDAFGLIERYRVTWMFGVPAMFAMMARAPEWETADLSSVRTLMCGGAPVPDALIATYQRRGLMFVQGYGLTETSPGALFLRAPDSVRKAGSAGTACFFTDVRLQDEEVLVSGPNVTPGYWNQPEATAAALDGDGWLRTGDAAVQDDEGYFSITGRLKDMFISGGENVYPAEVENALCQHPAVAECAVLGLPDPRWGEVGHAVVVLKPGFATDAPDLLTWLDGRLARYKIPKTLAFTPALPRNAAGKVLRSQLRPPPPS